MAQTHMLKINLRTVSLSLLVAVLCVACATKAPPFHYVPLVDTVFKKAINQTGTIPLIVYPDDPIEAIYDLTPAIPPGGTGGDLVGMVFAAGENAINSHVASVRKKEGRRKDSFVNE